jgi:hypothetical protein
VSGLAVRLITATSIWINAIWKPRSFKDSQPTMVQVC